MILDRGLATTQDIGNAWTEVTSLEGKQALLKKIGNDNVKYTEIQNLLMGYGGFTPPPTPKVPTHERSPPANKGQPLSGSPSSRGGFHAKRRGTYRSKINTQAHGSSDEILQNGVADSSWRSPENGERGKTRGRGRGRGRGHGRGRGRGRTD